MRGWLEAHEYGITDEDIVFEDGKYYPMFRAVQGKVVKRMTPAELYFGRVVIQRSPQVLLSLLDRESQKNRRIMEGLSPDKSSQAARFRELGEAEAWIAQIRMDCRKKMAVVSELCCR